MLLKSSTSTHALAASVFAASMIAGASSAHAGEPNRRGVQLEGVIGGAACIDGRVDCEHDVDALRGRARPSFAIGATAGFRPVKWLLLGGLYRWGMFTPSYQVDDSDAFRWSGQHTIAALIRPILPVWRLDLGLNIAPGYGRQVFRLPSGRGRDYSQGFSMLTGPTVDFRIAERLFVGAELDFIFNTQRRACRERADETVCFDASRDDTPAPTHQVIFGFHIGATFL